MTNIVAKKNQLDQLGKQVDQQDEKIRFISQLIQRAQETLDRIHAAYQQIRQSEQKLAAINWLNPLKVKENRSIKENGEKSIARANETIVYQEKGLDDFRQKLGFTTEKEFAQIKQQHEEETPGLLDQNRKVRQTIRQEREVLQKAENAHKSIFIRKTAAFVS
ncbi:hypothetical protein ACNRWW_19690 [Metabacillus sp. HB246100]